MFYNTFNNELFVFLQFESLPRRSVLLARIHGSAIAQSPILRSTSFCLYGVNRMACLRPTTLSSHAVRRTASLGSVGNAEREYRTP